MTPSPQTMEQFLNRTHEQVLVLSRHPFPCPGGCGLEVSRAPSGFWYITLGHAGFNTPENNAEGYGGRNEASLASMACGGSVA